ncbi:metal-sensitive transcriptional repressor family protein [Stackebrandtia soli]|uniref:metal-sensitive transcriptional repressor family protein n=1 Tax=Stackebrandtia soli TaxID=1892856 RepID=UPI0039EBF5EA
MPTVPGPPLVVRIESRLAAPVTVAAIASVPAVFLAAWGNGTWATVGFVVDWIAAGVLWFEWLILFVLSTDRLGWLKRHKWTCAVALLSVPAVLFTLGPAQLLRLAFVVGTLRVMRVRRIVTAARVVNRRLEPRRGVQWLLYGFTFVVSGLFVAVLLLDPNGETWLAVELVAHHVGFVPAVVLTGIATATGAVYWWTHRRTSEKRGYAAHVEGDQEA